MALPFLLEIGAEELPASYLAPYAEQLLRLFTEAFSAANLAASGMQTAYTPRRLVFFCKRLAEQQPLRNEELKGPPKAIAFQNGQPTRAALGFAEKAGLPLEKLETRVIDGKEYLFASVTRGGAQTADLLATLIPTVIRQLKSPKSMRWEDKPTVFARPIRWIMALFGNTVIPAALDGIIAGNITHGHRFLAPKPIKLRSARYASFAQRLLKAQVILEHAARVAEITRQLLAHGAREEKIDSGLVQVCADLVEWPSVVRGAFPETLRELPEPVLVTSLKKHQKSFCVYDDSGALAAGFLSVANNDITDESRIRDGYERVIVARLDDAKFFWDEDRKKKLSERVEALKTMVFQEKLGTYHDKTLRVQTLARYLAETLCRPELAEPAARAALLARADLTTAMVYEFPELQGVMGSIYARGVDNEPAAVAEAIQQMYQPRGADDALPQSPIGALLSIADKMDTISGCFAVGFGPTGSGDPYALRRQSLGVLRIFSQHDFRLSLSALSAKALEPFAAHAQPAVREQILQLFHGRLETVLKDLGIRYDVINAVLASGWDDVARTVDRARQLMTLLETEDFRRACTIIERCHNITRDQQIPAGAVDPAIFDHPLERALWTAWNGVAAEIAAADARNDAGAALACLSSRLYDALHAFFDQVRVMEDNAALRTNRLRMVRAIHDELAARIADLSRIVFEGAEKGAASKS